ncbi:hypothetical protein QUA07_27980 [Microcoleus sp. T3_A4]|uniref:hypothetical protein n=1 Tax=Microcoleus sp. T3_A4 TaxID=2818968 RepID=UPI002FD21C2F
MIVQTQQPNNFTEDDADRLWEYLDESQKKLAEKDEFLLSLPKRKEIIAIGILIIEALKEADRTHLISSLYFDISDSKYPHQGVFRIPHYHLITEHWKECSQCQSLTQDLTELIEWMID